MPKWHGPESNRMLSCGGYRKRTFTPAAGSPCLMKTPFLPDASDLRSFRHRFNVFPEKHFLAVPHGRLNLPFLLQPPQGRPAEPRHFHCRFYRHKCLHHGLFTSFPSLSVPDCTFFRQSAAESLPVFSVYILQI